MQPYLSKVCPPVLAAFAMPQADTVRQVSRAIVTFVARIAFHPIGKLTNRRSWVIAGKLWQSPLCRHEAGLPLNHK